MTLPGITIRRFADGRIAEDRTVSDNLELLRRARATARTRAHRSLSDRAAAGRALNRSQERGGARPPRKSRGALAPKASALEEFAVALQV